MKLFIIALFMLSEVASAASLLSSRRFRSVVVTPTISTSAYDSSDRLGTVQTIPVTFTEDDVVVLHSISIVDAGIQMAGMDILFFSQLPTIASADNAAFDMSDANALFFIGAVHVATADYISSASNAVASVRNIEMALKSFETSGGTKTNKIYAVVKVFGIPDYVSTTDLQFTYLFEE